MYVHDVRITCPAGPGTYEDLVLRPAEDMVVYDGKADVQDMPRDAMQKPSGQPNMRYDAKVFFPLGEATDALFSPGNMRLRHNMALRSTSPLGVEREGRIRDVRDLDQSVMVKWARDVQA